MPYKDIEDYRANRRLKRFKFREYERMDTLKKFRAQGVEPVDLNDQKSNLICFTCGKESPRSSRPRNRHYVDCTYAQA